VRLGVCLQGLLATMHVSLEAATTAVFKQMSTFQNQSQHEETNETKKETEDKDNDGIKGIHERKKQTDDEEHNGKTDREEQKKETDKKDKRRNGRLREHHLALVGTSLD
jgi:hypothetical protein